VVTVARVLATLILAAMVALSLGLVAFLDLSGGPASAAGPDPTATAGGLGSDDPGEDPGDPTSRPVAPTPNASVVITAPPEDRAEVRGTILFVRTGDIWAASGESLRQLSDKGTDSWPIWAADGSRIFFYETRRKVAQAPYQGRFSKITLYYPVLMSMAPDGSDRQQILSSLYDLQGPPDAKYFFQMLQMDMSPDGRTFALVSDMPNPFETDITLSTLPVTGGDVRNLDVKRGRGFGHNDPDWSPDGTRIAISYNGRSGSVGTPRVAVYTLATKTLKFVGPRGYANPSWSPDGRYLVVERTDGKGRDIAILDVATGDVVNQVTADGNSFAPAFSPDGTQIAYLRVNGQAIDLRILTLGPDGNLQVIDDKAITRDGSIDPGSSLAWSMPDGSRPSPSVPPTGSPPAGESPSAAPSTVPSAPPVATRSPEASASTPAGFPSAVPAGSASPAGSPPAGTSPTPGAPAASSPAGTSPTPSGSPPEGTPPTPSGSGAP
jgi:dipeptidyl aminopeptidase/acylaminoacyl peptidase